MVHIPWRLRATAFATKIGGWQYVNEKITDFSKAEGSLTKLLLLPGIGSVILKALFGEQSSASELIRLGWRKEDWVQLLAPWIASEILKADPQTTQPLVLNSGHDYSRVTVYQGIGLASHFYKASNSMRESFYSSPGGVAEAWACKTMQSMGGGIFRLQPKKIPSDNGDPHDDEDTHLWDLVHEPWSEGETWVEGPWSPSAGEISKALFPKKESGRSVLVWGPSGAGKTETTTRACRLAHGDFSKVLVVHGSVFATRGLSGGAAASLVKVLGACALIVDDMPPTATVKLLEEVEALYREKVAVALTLMTTGENNPKLPGLRPGRIDEIFEFSSPDAEGRLSVLKAYAPNIDWGSIAQDTRAEKLTPAYLRELAKRVSRGEDPERALVSLARQREIAS